MWLLLVGSQDQRSTGYVVDRIKKNRRKSEGQFAETMPNRVALQQAGVLKLLLDPAAWPRRKPTWVGLNRGAKNSYRGLSTTVANYCSVDLNRMEITKHHETGQKKDKVDINTVSIMLDKPLPAV